MEEVIAAAIWSAIERGATYRAELGAPGFWLWRIGVNAAQDELRKAATRRRHESTVAREPEQAREPGLPVREPPGLEPRRRQLWPEFPERRRERKLS